MIVVMTPEATPKEIEHVATLIFAKWASKTTSSKAPI